MARELNPSEEAVFESFALASKQAGCPVDQMMNFARAGVFPQIKQLEFCACAREADELGGPNLIGFGGSRGGGKSFIMLGQMGLDDCQRVPGLKCLLLRKVGKANQENFDDFRRRLFPRMAHDWSAQRGVLTFKNGSRIIAGHFQNEKDIDAYLGLEYDVIGIEEATTLSYSKFKNILTCLRTSKPNWRPRCYATTNPGGVGHAWFKKVLVEPFKRKLERETRFIPATVLDNKFVNVEYKQVLESLTGWQKAAWLHGDWDICAGQYFSNWREEFHVRDVIDESGALEWFAALDYGYTHYTAVTLGFMDGDGNIFIVDEYGKRQTDPQDHAAAIKDMLSLHNVRLEDLQYFAGGKDCFSKKEDGTTIADTYRELGINLVPAEIDRQNGWAAILKRLGDVDNGIKPSLLIHRRCKKIIETIPILQHDPNKPEDVEKVDCDENGDGGDDFADSLRYLLATNPTTKVSWAKPVTMGNISSLSLGGGEFEQHLLSY